MIYNRVIWSIARLFSLLYYIGTISFRVCLRHPIVFGSSDVAFLFLDYFVDLFSIIDLIWQYRSNSIVPEFRIPFDSASGKINRTSNVVSVTPRNSEDKTPILKSSKIEKIKYRFSLAWQIISLFPFEVIAYGAGMNNFGYLRLFRLMRSVYLPTYFNMVIESLERARITLNSGVQRLLFVVMIELICTHLAACIFYAIAIYVLHTGDENNWLSRDGIAELQSNGDIIFHETIHYRYIRAWYWAATTIAVVGYGDVSAWSESETWFVTIFFYVTMTIACINLSNFSIAVINYYAAKVDNRLKVVRFTKYALYRKLPTELTNRVLSYYEYQWQLLKGVDENTVSDVSVLRLYGMCCIDYLCLPVCLSLFLCRSCLNCLPTCPSKCST